MDSKTLAVIIALLGTLSVLYTQHEAKPELTAFAQYKANYNMKFDSMFEESYREKVFLENLARIEKHNSDVYNTYKMGVNQFTTLTQE
jgi:hypothetical protein